VGALDVEIDVLETIGQASRLTTVEDFERLMSKAFGAFEIKTYVSAQTLEASGIKTARVHFGQVNEEFARNYAEQRLFEHDAVMRRALLPRQSFFSWSDLIEQGDVQESEQKLFNIARECGALDGFITPSHHSDGSATAVSLSTKHKMDYGPAHRDALYALSICYSDAGKRVQADGRFRRASTVKLTKRQRECLQWVRAGKTSWEISVILSIAEDTVDEHLDAARKKLGVNTRTQAVIEAVLRGLIHI
jgi:LuxR family quorum sensing-dependent transcriptional regulator